MEEIDKIDKDLSFCLELNGSLLFDFMKKVLGKEDTHFNEPFRAFLARVPLMYSFLRMARMCYHKRRGFERVHNHLLEFCDNEYARLKIEKCNNELGECLRHFNQLIMSVASKFFPVRDPQLFNSDKRHQFLGIVISFYLENLELLHKSQKMDPENNNPSYFDLSILFLKSEIEKKECDMVKIEKLIEGLRFSTAFLCDIPLHYPEAHNEKLVDLLDDIEVVADKVGSLFHKLLTCIATGMAEISLVVPGLLQNIEHIKGKIEEYVEKVQPTICSSNELLIEFGATFMAQLIELHDQQQSALLFVDYEIGSLIIELASPINYLKNSSCRLPEEELKKVMAQFADVINKVEYVVNSFFVQDSPLWYFRLRYSLFVEEIQLIEKAVKHFEETKQLHAVAGAEADISRWVSSQMVNAKSTQVMIDIDQEQEIKDQILGKHDKGLQLISIVGMPGLGKTTLAKKIYHDPIIESQFQVRSWCDASPTFQKRELLLNILASVDKDTNTIYNETNEKLQEKLYQLLKGKGKYLVIIDDIWDINALDDFLVCFPNDNIGSRIIFTSRNEDMSLRDKRHTNIKLRFLSADECWYLLRHNIFENGKCPLELEGVGKEIATKCLGLPLLVNLVAAHLKDKEKECKSWKEFSMSLWSQKGGDSNVTEIILEQMEKVIVQCYELLPNNLKACFLYCSGFRKEKAIPARKLIRLWVAEGFIMTSGTDSPETTAEKYLTNLINRNLLLVVHRRTNGSIKSCRIHALLHDFCLKKAAELKFLKVVDRPEQHPAYGHSDYSLFHDSAYASPTILEEDHRLSNSDLPSSIAYGHNVYALLHDSAYASPTIFEEHHRLAVLNGDLRSSIAYGHSVYSLLHDAYASGFLMSSSEVTNLLRFKLLKVLDLEQVGIYDVPSEIGQLGLLKYLAMGGYFQSCPKSLTKLWNLETLILSSYELSLSIDFLDVINGIYKLRHLQLGMSFCPVSILGNKATPLRTVQTLSFILIHPELEQVLKCFPNLRKLKCVLPGTKVDGEIPFPKLDFLGKLEVLHARYRPSANRVSRNCLPCLGYGIQSNIRQLTLLNFWRPWEDMSRLARLLPELEILKLISNAFNGEEWDMEHDDVVFSKLKFLKMERLNVKYWKVGHADQFPHLQQLELISCGDLLEIPFAFANIESLNMIKIKSPCKNSAIKSGMEIKKQQLEYNEKFEFIAPLLQDSVTSFLQH